MNEDKPVTTFIVKEQTVYAILALTLVGLYTAYQIGKASKETKTTGK